MADEAEPRLVALDLRRRDIGVRARRPSGPPMPLPPAPELPAQHLAHRFRWRAIGIEEVGTVEMIGDWTTVIRHANPVSRYCRLTCGASPGSPALLPRGGSCAGRRTRPRPAETPGLVA